MDVQPQSQQEPSEENIIQSLPHEPSSMSKQNDKYFFDEDPMALFQVEDQLFKVHQYHLARESEQFREMLAKHYEAGKNERPIELPGVTVPEFERLLDYFYKPYVLKSNQDFLDLLNASHVFQVLTPIPFAKKRLDIGVIRKNSVLTSLEKLILGDRYGFKDWTSKAYEELLHREESVSEAEAIALGFDRLAGLIKAREEQLKTEIRSTESRVLNLTSVDLEELESLSASSSFVPPSHSVIPAVTLRGRGRGRGGFRGSGEYRGRGRGG